jgi:hypothetical protein
MLSWGDIFQTQEGLDPAPQMPLQLWLPGIFNALLSRVLSVLEENSVGTEQLLDRNLDKARLRPASLPIPENMKYGTVCQLQREVLPQH